MADQLQAAVSIPLPHIVDATAGAVRAAGLARVGLLGTRFVPLFPTTRLHVEAASPAAGP